MHYEPSVRKVSDAAIPVDITDFADDAVAEMTSVNDDELAFHLRAMDCGLAIHEYGLATAVHALATVSARDQTAVSPPTATVKVVHERQPTPVNTSYKNCSTTDGRAIWSTERPVLVCQPDPPVPAIAVDVLQLSGHESAADGHCAVVETSKHFRPYVQRFTPCLRDSARRSNMQTGVPFLPRCPLVRAELLEEAKVPALPGARGLHPLTTVARPRPGTDVTIDGGVKMTNVTVFATDPNPTVGPTARDCSHAAPCNLLPGFVGGESSRRPAPSVRACLVTGLEFLNMPFSDGGGLLCTLASAGCPTLCEIPWLLTRKSACCT